MNKILTAALLATASSSFAGEAIVETAPKADAFANAIRPISNPTLFDLALPTTNVHGIYAHHTLPGQVSTIGGLAPVDGDVNVYALQLEYALNERFSIVATKDGYVDMNPEGALAGLKDSGFANLAAGVKYAFIFDEAAQQVVSGTATIEVPTGNGAVFQGNGDGGLNLILNGLKLQDKWQFAGSIGARIPFDSDADSTTAFLSTHVSYQLTEKFTPLVELNWYRVLSAGDGSSTPISGITTFEGGDIFNLGASNAKLNKDIVTLAVGARYAVNDCIDLGASYELPLTDEEENLMDSRITIDAVWKF